MLEDKAKDLGRTIGQSAEYQAVKRANDALGADREATTALRRMEELRHEAQRMLDRNEQPTPAMEQELDELLGKLQDNAVFQRATVADENFNKLMVRVNEWISEGIQKGAASPIITLG